MWLNINKSDKNHISLGPLKSFSALCEIGRSAIKDHIGGVLCHGRYHPNENGVSKTANGL